MHEKRYNLQKKGIFQIEGGGGGTNAMLQKAQQVLVGLLLYRKFQLEREE